MIILETMPSDNWFYDWSHCGGKGSICINDQEKLGLNDILEAGRQRRKIGLGRISSINLHACDTADTKQAVNAWIGLAKEFRGYPELTAQAWPPKINPQLRFTHPINYDPNRKGTAGSKKNKKKGFSSFDS